MSDRSKWLAQVKEQGAVLSEAYRLRLLGRLWWTNLMLVVLPAASATAAAIFAARPEGIPAVVAEPLVAGLAGAAAVLTAIHRALKCDEYQAECLRLSSAYQGIAVSADHALLNPQQEPGSLQELAQRLVALTESAKAPLPTTYIGAAEKRTGYRLYDKPASLMGAEAP